MQSWRKEATITTTTTKTTADKDCPFIKQICVEPTLTLGSRGRMMNEMWSVPQDASKLKGEVPASSSLYHWASTRVAQSSFASYCQCPHEVGVEVLSSTVKNEGKFVTKRRI